MGYKIKNLGHNIKDFFKYMDKKYLVIFVVIIIAVSITLAIVFKPSEEEEDDDSIIETAIVEIYNLVLFGPDEVSIYEGDTYQEIGYYATLNNKIVTENVVVNNNLDTNKIGRYTITYSIGDIVKTRIVNVIEKNNTNISNIKLEVIGNTEIHLTLGDTYHDAGCQAFDKDNNNISSKIKTTNPVNTNKVGIYYITYSITLDNETKNTKRLVVVHPKENTSGNNQGNGSQGNSNQSGGSYGSTNENNGIKVNTLNISTNYSNTYTKNNITISVSASGDNLAYIKLPNGNKVYGTTTSYEATSNGNYYFYVYDTNNNYNVTTARITTIDKTAPTLTCKAKFDGTKTEISVNSKDNSGIDYYNYANKYKSALSTFSVSEELDLKNLIVTAYDKAGNYTSAKCTVEKSNSAVIKPDSSENVVAESETPTLKVYISKKSGYYITRVWAENPYKQLHKFDSPEYGKNLYKPKKLLELARNKNNLSNTLLLGFNASAFYLKDTYDASEVSKYPKYDKTSVGTIVITEGEVIRNTYDKAYKTRFIAGVDKNNKLRVFKDAKASSTADINKKKEWANEVINSGIRNTFTHASVLIENGKKSSDTTSMPSINTKKNRQAICQVNDNNFVLITGSNLNRNDLQNIMLDLKCETGTNLDGGGSIALFFESHGSNTISTIIGNARSLTEVGYFSE